MPIDSKRISILRESYRETLLTVANEIGSRDRSAANATALTRLRGALGLNGHAASVGPPPDDPAARELVLEYVVSLRGVLKEMVSADLGAENQQVIRELESQLGGLL